VPSVNDPNVIASFSSHSQIWQGLLTPVIKKDILHVLSEQSLSDILVRGERPPWWWLQNATRRLCWKKKDELLARYNHCVPWHFLTVPEAVIT
jgi:hypothetical protein